MLFPGERPARRSAGEASVCVRRKVSYGPQVENLPGADVTPEELEFLKAMERYQRIYERRYPLWREVLFVAHCLGYRKVAPPVSIPRRGRPFPTFPDPDADPDLSRKPDE